MNTKKQKETLIFIIVVVLVVSFIFSMVRQKNAQTLDVYTQTDKVEQQETEEEETPDIPLETYADAEAGFSIGIPQGWDRANQDSGVTFVHSASASSIQLQVLPYDPAVNSAAAETMSAEVAEKGMTFTDFIRDGNSHYELLYQNKGDSIYDYIEEVYWDRSTIVKIICTFNDANYEAIMPYYNAAISSFQWGKTDPIPDGYNLYYNDVAKFEVGVPDTWAMSATDTAVTATDETTGASLTMLVQQTDQYLDALTAVNASSMLSMGRSNFMMLSYENSKESAKAVTSYVNGNVRYTDVYYLFANGSCWYILSYDYEEGTLSDETIPETSAGLFREFMEDVQEQDGQGQEAQVAQ